MMGSGAGGADEAESANGAGPAGGPGSAGGPADGTSGASAVRGPGGADEAGAGGRWVEVAPDRIVRWVGSFADRHGPLTAEPSRTVLILRGADGAVAECHPPFPPMAAPRTDRPGMCWA